MELYDKLNIPYECKIGKAIFKKLFYENVSLSSSDKVLFGNVIDKITWLYCLNPNRLNVPIYQDAEREYLEIEVVEVTLIEEKNLRRIAEIIMRTIPYPMLLFFRMNNNYQVWATHQRFNLSDKSKITLEDFVQTDWFDDKSILWDCLDFKKLRYNNYYAMYSDVIDTINVFNVKIIVGENAEITGTEAKELLGQVAIIDNEIASIRANLKKETQFNRKMELNIKIKKLEKEKDNLKNG